FAWRYYYSQCQRWRLTWQWPKGAIDAIAVSPDGKLLATSKEKVITLWELNTGKEVAKLDGHKQTVIRLTFAPNSQVLASGAQELDYNKIKGVLQPPGAEVKLWDLATKRCRFDFTAKEQSIASLSFSANGKAFAAGYYCRSARVWEVDSGRELA